MKNEAVTNFIKEHLMECTRVHTVDEDTIIGLPYPYSVPCPSHFQELYYWDTYFLNFGLMATGNFQQAKNNVDDFLFLVDKYGFVPNANRTYYLSRTQPPFLSLMVKEIFERTEDTRWLRYATDMLIKEHSYWMTKRITPIGLNQYGSEVPDNTVEKRFNIFQNRVAIDASAYDKKAIANTVFAHAESGWDCTPRFEYDALSYIPVDLNSLLYSLEMNIFNFSNILGDTKNTEVFAKFADKRKMLMDKYLWCKEQGAYLDYNYREKKFSPVFSAASFYPLFARLADEERAKATVSNLARIECPSGIAACEKNSVEGRYQWDYPNAWAPIQFVVANGLAKYGWADDAQRIGKKYMATVEGAFEQTGNLWEKYNALDGSINVTSEKKEQMPVMLGWSAGVYMWFKENLTIL